MRSKANSVGFLHRDAGHDCRVLVKALVSPECIGSFLTIKMENLLKLIRVL